MPSTQTIEFECVPSQTLTVRLFAAGSDAVVQTASAVAEQTNRTGIYLATFTDVAAGTYRLIARNTANTKLADWWVDLTLTTATFVAYQMPASMSPTAAATATAVRTELATELGRIDATISSRSTFAGGAVASVTGNVGGNVVGSVGSIAGVTFPTHFNDLQIAANGHVSAAVQSIANNSITNSSIQGGAISAAKFATDAITAAAISADAVTEIQAGLATSTALSAAQADLDNIQTRLPAALISGRMDSNVQAIDAAVIAAIQSGLSTLTAGQVNAEVVDALNVDTYAEPGAVPPALATLVQKINWLYLLARNKLTQTASTQTVFADNQTTPVSTAAVSDDGTTATRGEFT